MKLRWRFGVIAGIFLAIFCLYPQFKLLYLRGDDWNGHYAYNDIDEVAYASYVRALIDGRPRKNDPYSGCDQSPETLQPESLFSIQFAAPYTIAIPSRLLGIGVPLAITLAGALAGFLAALAVFWFLGSIIGDNWYAMAGALAVFCFGTLAAGEGAILEIAFDGFSYPYFPGFRRYIPALAMPAFFCFVGSIWCLIGREVHRESGSFSAHPELPRRFLYPNLIFGSLAVACFAYCVFSYFYTWTTAAAFLGCVVLVWLVERPDGWKGDLRRLSYVGVGCLAALIPYFYLLSKRAETLDHVQLLVRTRMPDLFRFPEYIGFTILIILIAGLALKAIYIKDRSTLFVLALSLVPFVVFNQQVITGRSLQPIHYQVFIGNYVSSLALFAAIGLLIRQKLGGAVPRILCSILLLISSVWGIVECHYTVRVLDEANIERDRALPVAKFLEELSGSDPDPYRTTVISFDWLFADDLPSVAPQNVLWARHQHVFAGLTWEENKRRFYLQLYYQKIDEKGLDHLLKNDFVTQIALFGWGRHTDRLSADSKPLTYGEIAEEVGRYKDFRANFTREQASDPQISYVIVPNDRQNDLSAIEEWYSLGQGKVIGGHTLYETALK